MVDEKDGLDDLAGVGAAKFTISSSDTGMNNRSNRADQCGNGIAAPDVINPEALDDGTAALGASTTGTQCMQRLYKVPKDEALTHNEHERGKNCPNATRHCGTAVLQVLQEQVAADGRDGAEDTGQEEERRASAMAFLTENVQSGTKQDTQKARSETGGHIEDQRFAKIGCWHWRCLEMRRARVSACWGHFHVVVWKGE
ncbi:hypothetical protein BT63DRAFT_458569 [Microthyrium microscopicum]|uniref:Uncharacterized protein n=1 Tax=Microthyrium microscopicum TaxID=703497 RepID=A0A6A6U5H9_9PEZI|nr:hypothetical protein BT63DRAFT_458569 [Microthyrium microscopicum]